MEYKERNPYVPTDLVWIFKPDQEAGLERARQAQKEMWLKIKHDVRYNMIYKEEIDNVRD
jgi:hypothetical protein